MKADDYIREKYKVDGGDSFMRVGGMNRVDLYKLFAELGFKNGCELGVWEGKNAFNMFENIPDVKLLLIDPYINHPYVRKPRGEDRLKNAKRRAHRRLDDKNGTFIEMLGEDAIGDIPDGSLDFVYIDAEHTYNAVMLDILLWSRKVRKGGIISGHDYYRDLKHHMGVDFAVNDYTKANGIPFYITDRTAEPEEKRHQIASWFWVKT